LSYFFVIFDHCLLREKFGNFAKNIALHGVVFVTTMMMTMTPMVTIFQNLFVIKSYIASVIFTGHCCHHLLVVFRLTDWLNCDKPSVVFMV